MKSVALIVLAGGVLFFVAIHALWYIKPSNIKDMAALNAELHNGQPTVVELYSNL
jgi:hypothetical protein